MIGEESSMDQELKQYLEGMEARADARFDSMETRFDSMEARFDSMDARFDSMNAGFASLSANDTH